MEAKKYDPNEPVLKAIERLGIEPWYATDEIRRRAENDPALVEIGKQDAYAIFRNGGCKNQAEIDKMKGGAK